MLAPHVHGDPKSPGITERNRLLLGLEQDSHRIWEGYRKELQQVSGIDIGYRPGGSLQVSQDTAEERELLSEYELQKRLGLDIEWLSARRPGTWNLDSHPTSRPPPSVLGTARSSLGAW